MTDQGNFAFGGQQRSYSFPRFHADRIPTTAATDTAEQLPNMECEQVWLRNSVNSSGNIVVGVQNRLDGGLLGGITLEKGDILGWIPVNNLNLIWHIDAANSYLEYMLIR